MRVVNSVVTYIVKDPRDVIEGLMRSQEPARQEEIALFLLKLLSLLMASVHFPEL